MGVVQDPSFWRRFSLAAHLDEEAQRPELKHTYVKPLPSPPASALSHIHIQEDQHSINTNTKPKHKDTITCSVRTSIITVSTSNPFATPMFSEPASPSNMAVSQDSKPLSRSPSSSNLPSKSKPPTRTPSKLRKPLPTHKTPSHSPFAFSPRSPRFPFSHPNHSTFTIGLSGRPSSRFNFWTSVSAAADPRNRESWLEQQRKKKSKRTCMCWVFWLVLMSFVAGIVVVILYLKARGII